MNGPREPHVNLGWVNRRGVVTSGRLFPGRGGRRPPATGTRRRTGRGGGRAAWRRPGRGPRPGRRRRRGRAWASTLPRAVASTGPATTGRPLASAVSRHSRSLRLPPPTRCTTSISTAERAAACRNVTRCARAGCPGCSGRSPRGHVLGNPRRRQCAAMRDGMSPGGRNSGSSGSISERRPGTSAASASRAGRSGFPSPQRLLEQPQAHHVAQVADGPVDSALVGEVGLAARLGQHGRVQFDADQRPGATGDVGEPIGGGGDGGDGRRGVV